MPRRKASSEQGTLFADVDGPDLSKCVHCGVPATHLCDYVLGYAADPSSGRVSEAFTCDRPLCRSCLTNKGAMFLDWGSPRRGAAITNDYCRDHAEEGRHERGQIITSAQAEAMRERLRFRVVTGGAT